LTDLLALCRTSATALYAAFPTITLDIPTARKQFNEEQGELQEAATGLFLLSRQPAWRIHVAAELADVLYTAMGLAEACGISPDDLAAAVVAKCAKNDAKRPENGYMALNSKIQKGVAK